MKIGIIGGTGLSGIKFLENSSEDEIETRYGRVYILKSDNVVFIPRHGKNNNIPPHMINYGADMMALKDMGVKKIVGISSVGSLKKKITPGSILIPHDYINLWNIQSYYDNEILHITPELDEGLREIIIQTAKKLKIKIIEKGIYFQTSGPRLETKAEINFIKNYADVIGMTMASEATLAKELNLRYGSICSVDNYCHGIIDEKLDFKKVVERASNGRGNLLKLLTAVIEALKELKCQS